MKQASRLAGLCRTSAASPGAAGSARGCHGDPLLSLGLGKRQPHFLVSFLSERGRNFKILKLFPKWNSWLLLNVSAPTSTLPMSYAQGVTFGIALIPRYWKGPLQRLLPKPGSILPKPGPAKSTSHPLGRLKVPSPAAPQLPPAPAIHLRGLQAVGSCL